MPTQDIIALAQAGGLVLFVGAVIMGAVWAKPGVDFIMARLKRSDELLDAALLREGKLADAVVQGNVAIKELTAEIRGLRNLKGGAR